MLQMKTITFALIIVLLVTHAAFTQQRTAIKRIPADIVDYYTGTWNGQGAFASGKPISAVIDFKPILDSCCLLESHADVAPNKYKAESIWGVDGITGQLTMDVYDNFGGHRVFTSAGWLHGKMVFDYTTTITTGQTRFERFTYQKETSNSFIMRYETSIDNVAWKLGDQLTFVKI
jgi:hypothetical protein